MKKTGFRACFLLAAALGPWGTGGAASAAGALAPGADLEQALTAAGWETERLSDGSLNLRWKGQPGLADDPAKPVGEPSAVREDDIWAPLRSRGWRIETDQEGSTLLYPPKAKAVEGEVPQQRSAQPEAGSGAQQQTLEQMLEQRNWRVERAADGSLLLYPQAPERKAVAPAPGITLAPVRDKEIALPVDEWAEARRLAQAWIDVFGGPSMAVGKIRKVLRVYVVSITASSAPYHLKHQLAINASDGRIVVLN